MKETKFIGKKVLITGSGTGIGRGVALEFARQGAAVVLHYSHSDRGAKSAVEEIRSQGGKAEAIQANFNVTEEARKLGEKAVAFLGGLDVLVNNAGITLNSHFEKITPEQFDTLYNVNVKSPLFLTQAVVPALIDSGSGSIINMSSVHAYGGYREHVVYAGTKGAIVSSMRTLAIELSTKGIRVNAIIPGWVCVENQKKEMGDDFDWESAGQILPAGFVGTPLDVAKLATFLASDDARYIVGQCLTIDGGQLAILPNTGDFHEPIAQQWGKGYVPGL